MKFSTTLALSAAPLAMAKAVRNAYPAKNELIAREPQLGSLAAELQLAGLSGLGITSGAASEIIIIWVNPGAGAATTTVNPPAAAPPAAAAPTGGAAGGAAPPPAAAAPPGAAATHQVMVGGTAGLTYQPDQITAAVGDMVVFTFMSANHTVTQSGFASPCVAMAGGMDSGFQANPNNSVNPPPQVAMQVMVDTPLWFYCRQKGHCGKGMTFSINPTAAKTQAMFQSMAIAQNGTGAGSAITGGGAAAGNGSAAAPPAAAPPAAAPPAAQPSSAPAAGAGTGGTTSTGTGTLQNGQCQCAVTCSVGNLPAANAQGLGMFGGMAGALPMAMSEPVINAAAGRA